MISFKQKIQNCIPRVGWKTKHSERLTIDSWGSFWKRFTLELVDWVKGIVFSSVRGCYPIHWEPELDIKAEEKRNLHTSGSQDFSFRIEFLPLVFGSQEFALYHRLSWVSNLQKDHLGLHNCTIYICVCVCVCVCIGEGNGNILQYSCLENSMDRRAWQAIYSPWGHKESDMTEQLTTIYI